MKVCAAADKGQPISPDTVTANQDEESEESSNGQEWKHDFDKSGEFRLYILFQKTDIKETPTLFFAFHLLQESFEFKALIRSNTIIKINPGLVLYCI